VDGELAGAGAHEVAGDAYVVAEVEEFVEGEGGLADVVFADVNLEPNTWPQVRGLSFEEHIALLELREAGFALDADGHDAAGDGDFDLVAADVVGFKLG